MSKEVGMVKKYVAVWYFLGIFLLMTGQSDVGFSAGQESISPEVQIAWSEFNGQTYQIFFSQKLGKTWTSKKQLSTDNRSHLIPSLSADENGRTWVVWAASDGIEFRLNVARYDGRNWSESSELPTGMTSNTAPAITVDGDGIPWVVWAGFDGQDDDIFFSRWNGAGWDTPARVHADNVVPDILPTIGIGSNGFPWVRWSGFDRGDYHFFITQWLGKDWGDKTEESQAVSSHSAGGESLKISASEISEIVSEPKKASVYFPNQTVDNRSILLRDKLLLLKNSLN
ncbi:MAG: hypothetical protein WA151_16760 [Desulfatirhabdiaceae bacterium]